MAPSLLSFRNENRSIGLLAVMQEFLKQCNSYTHGAIACGDTEQVQYLCCTVSAATQKDSSARSCS